MNTSSIPTATASAGVHDGPARPANSQPAASASPTIPNFEPESYSVGSFRREVRRLVAESSGPTQAFGYLLKLLHSERGVVASSLRIRFGASTISDFAFNKSSVSPGKEQAFKGMHDDLLQSIQSDDAVVRTQAINQGKSLLATLAIPIPFASLEAGRGAVVVSVIAANKESVQSLLHDFTDAISFAAALLAESKSPTQAKHEDRDLHAMGRTSDFRSSTHMAFALVNNLAGRYDCEQVGLGFVKGNRIEVVAVSGMATFKANSPGIVDMRQSMEECFDDRNVIVSQSANALPEFHERPIHRQWSQNTRSAVCSMPLVIAGEMVAIVSLRRTATAPFLVDEIGNIQEAIKPFASPIHLYRKSERTLAQHVIQSARAFRKQALSPKSATGLAARVACLAVVAFLIFGFVPYQPKCTGRIVPANLTHMQASFDMRLSQVLVQPGQSVKQGDTLARFDTKVLELERSQFDAELARYEAEMRNFSNQGDTSNASISKAKAAVFKAKLRATERKIAECELKAPYDGIVLEANLSRSIGQIFPQGAAILSIAPLNEYEVELRYPESVVPYILDSQKGSFASLSQPGKSMDFELISVDGTAVVEEGKNVLKARAKLLSPHDGIRPGVDGIAKTDSGWKPVLWVVFHGVYDYARYHFWI